MRIQTSKNQTLSGTEGDTLVALAVVGAVTVIGASVAGVIKGIQKVEKRIETGSWKSH